MAGRYPRHVWPLDPGNAEATRLTKKVLGGLLGGRGLGWGVGGLGVMFDGLIWGQHYVCSCCCCFERSVTTQPTPIQSRQTRIHRARVWRRKSCKSKRQALAAVARVSRRASRRGAAALVVVAAARKSGDRWCAPVLYLG